MSSKKDSFLGTLTSILKDRGSSHSSNHEVNSSYRSKISKQSNKDKHDSKLTDGKMQELKKAYSLFDQDGDGKITTKELENLMRSLGQNPSAAELECLIKEMDNNGNGSVDFNEFARLMSRKTRASTFEEELRESFKLFDRDGNGYITSNEIRNILNSIGEKVNDDELHEMLNLVDEDKDGKINYEEFVKMMTGK